MNIPEGVVDCWYISEVDKLKFARVEDCCRYQTDDYFKLVPRKDSLSVAGYLGRKDTPENFFNDLDTTYTYFSDYRNQKEIYFTFDKVKLFRVVNIFPEKPMFISLEQVAFKPINKPMLSQEDIYQAIVKEEWKKILDILHLHRKEIASDDLLQSAASTFEEVFFKKVHALPMDDEVTRENLDILYLLHYGKFYRLKPEHEKVMIVEMVGRNPPHLAYNYALQFPQEDICKAAIVKYESESTEVHIDWIEVYNRLFELINEKDDPATYFSGPRFILTVKKFKPYFPDYNQYIQLRNEKGKSTSRKIFYYDILMELDEKDRLKVTESILGIVKPFQPEKAEAIEMLLGKKSIDEATIRATETIPAKTDHPVVFISYSWDDEAHKEWVLQLAKSLVSNGVDVILDRFHLKAGRNLPHFVEQSIKKAEKVLIIFTPNYKLKADRRDGGVGYEYSILNADLYQNQVSNEKIIPVLRAGTMKTSIPKFMQQFIHMDLTRDDNFEVSLKDLLREIYSEPAIKKPEIGNRPDFDNREN